MKAADIIPRVRNWESNTDELGNVLLELLDEAHALVKARRCHTDAAFVAVYKEIHRKWRAVCTQVPGLPVYCFEEAVKLAMPDMHAALAKHRTFA